MDKMPTDNITESNSTNGTSEYKVDKTKEKKSNFALFNVTE